ncbi:MAG: hypothetical protein V3S14_17900 [Anaerolineae bacterium]
MSNEQILVATAPLTGKPWSINTDAPLQAIVDSPECPPLLRQTLTGTLSWQTRNETPIHRALTSARIAPQWLAALLALGATVTVERDDGPTEMPLESWAQRRAKEKMSTLHIRADDIAWGKAHVARTPADDPIVAAVAVVKTDGDMVRQARVVLTGVWSKPVSLAKAPVQLVDGPLDETSIQAVADAVEKEVTPKGNFLGSEEYRRAMAGVLTRRALEECRRQEAGDE